MHSIWCPSREELFDFESEQTRRNGRRHSRTTQPTPNLSAHRPHPTPTSYGQRRHASALPKNKAGDYDRAPFTPSRPVTPPAKRPPRRKAPHPKEVVEFLKYSNDKELLQAQLPLASDACYNVVNLKLVHQVPDQDRIRFAQRMLSAITIHWARDESTPCHRYATGVKQLLDFPLAKKDERRSEYIEGLQAQCSALLGYIDPADEYLRQMEYTTLSKAGTELLNAVLVSLARECPPEGVVDYLLDGMAFLPAIRFLDPSAAPAVRVLTEVATSSALPAPYSTNLPKPSFTTGSTIHPAVSLVLGCIYQHAAFKSKAVPKMWIQATTSALLCEQSRIEEMERLGLYGPGDNVYQSSMEHTSRTIAPADLQLHADMIKQLLSLYPYRDDFWYSSMLTAASFSGDWVQAAELFTTYSATAEPSQRDIRSLLMAYARAGEIGRLTDTFEQLFPPEDQIHLPIELYRPAFHALSRSIFPNQSALEHWKKKLTEANLPLDSRIYTSIVRYYARHDLGTAISRMFEEIAEQGITVSGIVYQIAMSHFAQQGQSLIVESLFQRAIEAGVKPDLHLLSVLMDAHVESGTWAGLLKAHQYIQTHDVPGDNPIVIFNILFKASHLLGVPFPILNSQFLNLAETGQVPDAHTYCTLAQAAVDAGEMGRAEELYREMVGRNKEKPGFLNPHIFSILIAGFMRATNVKKVAFYYGEMKKQGVKPNSAIFSNLIDGAAHLPHNERAQIDGLIGDMKATVARSDDWKSPGTVKGTWYEQIYLPMMAAALESGDHEQVKKVYVDVVDLECTPTLAMNTVLLDSYRRVGDAQSILELWRHMFKQAVSIKDAGSGLLTKETREASKQVHSDLLARPLSIFIDAMSSAGRHGEVARVCGECQEAGFRFDSHNWNRIVLALIRAGDPMPAFRIANDILLGYRDSSVGLNYKPKAGTSSSPLLWPTNLAVGSNRMTVGPLHDRRHRTIKAGKMARRLLAARTRKALILEKPSKKNPDATPLYQMINSLPTWGEWGTHKIVKKTLLTTFYLLESGFPIRPIKAGELDLPAIGRHNRQLGYGQAKTIKQRFRRIMVHLANFGVSERKRLGDHNLTIYRMTKEEKQARVLKKATERLFPKEEPQIPEKEEKT